MISQFHTDLTNVVHNNNHNNNAGAITSLQGAAPSQARRGRAPRLRVEMKRPDNNVGACSSLCRLLLVSAAMSLSAAMQIRARHPDLAGRCRAKRTLMTDVNMASELLSTWMQAMVPSAHATDVDLLQVAQRVSDTEALGAFGLGNAAKEGDIGLRPTLGGVNLFVFYVIYQIAFQIYLRTKNPDGANVSLINGKRYVDGKLADKDAKVVQTAEIETSRRGIAGMLGGGKLNAEVQKNPVVEAGSLAATVIVLGALVFGAVNPAYIEESAQKSQATCVEKIVRGQRIVCPSPTS